MNMFKYEAKNLEGKIIKGSMEGIDEKAVRKSLKNNGYYVVKIIKVNSGLNREITFSKKQITDADYAMICREIYFSLSSGVPLLESLEIVTEGIENKELKRILVNTRKDVESGNSFSSALKKHKKIPTILWSMVQVGEEVGQLDEIMNELSEFYYKQNEQKKKIKNSLLYPKFLLVFAMIVITFLVVYIVPIFIQNLQIAKGQIPIPTKIVMGISRIIGEYWVLIGIIIGILFIAKKMVLNKNKKYIYFRDKYLMNSRVLGKITQLIITARFASTFSILFSGGISVVRCFEIIANVIDNEYVREKLELGKQKISRGATIGEALEEYRVLPRMIIRTIKIGERSGSLDKILKKSASYYEAEANFKLEAISKLIEPIMIVILAFIVGFIVISMIMPIFAMYNAVMRY
ncbi:MAG: type II secretion system F family protein [Clostridium sp.]